MRHVIVINVCHHQQMELDHHPHPQHANANVLEDITVGKGWAAMHHAANAGNYKRIDWLHSRGATRQSAHGRA